MRRSLGDKRRFLTDEIISDLTREHGRLVKTETCKTFDNADFGYRRITVERPLRLRFQLTDEGKESFLDACPEFLDAVEAMEHELGTEPYEDWNEVWTEAQRIAKEADIRWTVAEKKLFRQCFTMVDPDARPVIARQIKPDEGPSPDLFPEQNLPPNLKSGELNAICGIYPDHRGKKGKAVEYESNPALRDSENIPLKEDIVSFFLREVRPFVPDAWINREAVDEQDGGIGKVGYEINFNREFFRYHPPRPLEEIDAELEAVERRILELLREVTE
jgi:type I restriction enzyme M protein